MASAAIPVPFVLPRWRAGCSLIEDQARQVEACRPLSPIHNLLSSLRSRSVDEGSRAGLRPPSRQPEVNDAVRCDA